MLSRVVTFRLNLHPFTLFQKKVPIKERINTRISALLRGIDTPARKSAREKVSGSLVKIHLAQLRKFAPEE